jgi:hypothetical protein
VSTTPETPAGQPADEAADDVELRSVIDPTSVRRAPRYKGFFVVGVVAGIVLGLGFGLYLLSTFDPERDLPLGKPGVWLSVIVLVTTTVTTLAAGLVASIIDRRSVRRRDAKRGV